MDSDETPSRARLGRDADETRTYPSRTIGGNGPPPAAVGRAGAGCACGRACSMALPGTSRADGSAALPLAVGASRVHKSQGQPGSARHSSLAVTQGCTAEAAAPGAVAGAPAGGGCGGAPWRPCRAGRGRGRRGAAGAGQLRRQAWGRSSSGGSGRRCGAAATAGVGVGVWPDCSRVDRRAGHVARGPARAIGPAP